MVIRASRPISEVVFIVDGGGSAITTGLKGFIKVDFSGKILSCTLLADQTGSVVVDIWKAPYNSFPPTNLNSICGTNKPAITNGTKYIDKNLTNWIKTINKDDVLAFNIDSASTITKLTICLKVKQ